MRRLFGIVAALVLSAAGTATAAQPSAAALAAVDKAFATEAATHPVGSLTVGVVDHGRLVWTKSYGLADMQKAVPANRRTVYRIGSITKQFTGLALLQLAADGKVSLDDAAVKYLPELKTVVGGFKDDPALPVTLLSLATHRAGLAREPNDLRYLQGPIDAWQGSVRQALAHTSQPFRPNGEANYSNIGYAALGLAIENAAGVPYTDLIERRIVRPLGMTSTTFRPDADMLARLAKGYVVIGKAAPSSAAADADIAKGRGYKIPNGGLFTTVDDLARFMAFEMGYGPKGVLAQDALAANFARSFPMLGGGRYGVGFTVEGDDPPVLVGHSGAVAGYTSSAFFDPQAKVGIVCLRSAELPCEGTFLLDALAAVDPAWQDRAQRAHAAAAEREARVAAQKPYPDGEAVLRRVISELQSGQPDYSRMSEPLAAAIHERLASQRARLSAMGALQSLSFRGVGPGGSDIYDAVFAGGARLEWRLELDHNDVVQGLSFGPPAPPPTAGPAASVPSTGRR